MTSRAHWPMARLTEFSITHKFSDERQVQRQKISGSLKSLQILNFACKTESG